MHLSERGVDRSSKIRRSIPRLEHTLPRRMPNVVAHRSWTVRKEENLEPVRRDRRSLIARRTVELRDGYCGAPRAILSLRAHVDISATSDRCRVPVEKQLCSSAVVVLEIAGAAFEARGVHAGSKIDRRLPREVVMHVRSPGGPDIARSHSPGMRRKEEQPMLIARQRRPRFNDLRVHRW